MHSKRIKVRKWVKVVFLFLILISIFFLYSRYIGVKGLKVKEYSIIDSKIPSNFYGLKIIHISDIHYKVTTDKEDLKNMVKEINLLKPDIVIFSGDMFDKNIEYVNEDIKNLKEIFNSINYNIGKFAIAGENDLNNKYFEEVLKASNFNNLNDTYELIYSNGIEPILLIGISSNYKNNHIEKTLNNIYKDVKEKYEYSMLILHEPDFIDNIDISKFNLILSGHSHNGQVVIPFIGGILKNKYSNIYYDNYYELNKTKIYISSGIGTNYKFKLRFLNKPSINLYRLRNK